MRKQFVVWQNEHDNSKALPSLSKTEPSAVARYFADFLKSESINSGKILDIGCGKGRNAIFLAEQGYDVYAFDYIESAVRFCQELAKEKKLQSKMNLKIGSMDETWLYPDNFFDASLDCFSSIDIETKKGREKYKAELRRTLKPGGYALISVVATKDEFEAKIAKENAGLERNSTIWPQIGKFQKNYDLDELLEFYDDFEIVEVKEVKKRRFKLEKYYNAVDYWLLLRKSEIA